MVCSTTESLNNAMTNYETLNGCEESIKTACTVDETILNDDITADLDNCKKSFDEIKEESKSKKKNMINSLSYSLHYQNARTLTVIWKRLVSAGGMLQQVWSIYKIKSLNMFPLFSYR